MKTLNRIRNHLDFILIISTCCFVVPFISLSKTIDPYLTIRFFLWSILTLVLLISFVYRMISSPTERKTRYVGSVVFVVYTGYLFFSLLSIINAVNPGESAYEIVKIFTSLTFLFLCLQVLAANPDYKFMLTKCLVISAFLLCCIGFYQYFTIAYGKPGLDILVSIQGTMGHKNLLSSALFLTLPFCFYSLLSSHYLWRILSGITAAMSLLMIFLLQTRAVWLALIVSSTLALLIVLLLHKQFVINKKIMLKTALLSLVILSACITAGIVLASKSDALDHLKERIQPSTLLSRGTGNERIQLWKKTVNGAFENLALGHGAGNWRISLPSYGLDGLTARSFKYVHFQRPHNDFIWVLFESGIFGFLCYVSIFIVSLFFCIKNILLHKQLQSKRLALCMLMSLTGYITIACFSFPKERIFHSMVLSILLAIILNLHSEVTQKRNTAPKTNTLLISIPCIIVLIFSAAVGYIRLKSEWLTKQSFMARNHQQHSQVIALIDKAYSPFSSLDPTSAPLQWYKAEAQYLMGNFSQALISYQLAREAHPYHIHVLNNLATCYEELQDHENAIYYYNKALEIHPQFQEALINLGATYYNCGRYEEAWQTLLRCKPDPKNEKLKIYLETVKKELDTTD